MRKKSTDTGSGYIVDDMAARPMVSILTMTFRGSSGDWTSVMQKSYWVTSKKNGNPRKLTVTEPLIWEKLMGR